MTRLPMYRNRNRAAPHHGEIWLAEALPFEDGIHSKNRPVVIKKREGDMFLCFKCTSQMSDFRERYRVLDLEEAGLTKYSFIDYEPIYVPREKLSYKLGVMSEEDLSAFGRL